MISEDIIKRTEKNVRDIVTLAIEYNEAQSAVVVYDNRSELAVALTTAYRGVIPKAKFIDFDAVTPKEIFAAFDALKPSDLVVLIQSSNFRLDDFRIRVELFKRSLKVIEHPHLGRMTGVETGYYLDSLAYDPSYYRGIGHALKECIDRAKRGIIDSGGEKLIFNTPFEPAKLNIGDYRGMKNIGGQFPIGEVFTEARDLEAVNGTVRIFVFGDTTYAVNKPEKPITLKVNKGRVTDVINSTAEFERVIANIRADDGEVWLREFGCGMNPAFTAERLVRDIGTYERMCGVHFSLGAKHGLYKKPGFKDKIAKHHVDIFTVTKSVTLDNLVVFQNGAWQV